MSNWSNRKSESFLNPNNFTTSFDNERLGKQQYAEGLKVGKEAQSIHIAINDVWNARMKNDSSLQSYEKLGYHANTSDLLRGFIDSKCEIIVHRYVEGSFVSTKIQ